MKLIRGLHNLAPLETGCVATIGNFDGVHQGHQIIIRQLREKAASLKLPTAVMVFEPQPREYFDFANAPPRLMRFREKLEALAKAGIDVVVCMQFNLRFRSLTAQEFVDDVLISGLYIKHLVVGDDFRFGCDRTGDFHLLQNVGQERGFTVDHTPTIEIDGDRVSSTRIRQLLQAGEFDLARHLLGRCYSISGRIVHGRKLGRQINVPTANVRLGRKNPVLQGVYVVRAILESGEREFGVANIGLRPTVAGDDALPALEVHLLSFSDDLYGQRLTVEFLHRLRGEQKFPGLQALQDQIRTDIAQAKAVIARYVEAQDTD